MHACVERENPLPEFVIKPDAARIKRRRWGTKPWQAHEEVCGRPLSNNRWLRWTSAIHPSTLSSGIPGVHRFLASSASVRSRARPALAIPVPENTMTAHPTQLAKDFRHVAKLAGFSLAASDLTIESLSAPHRPPTRLPPGTMAVYLFRHQGRVLKIGKAGPNSNARYTSQHYSPGAAQSTLAASWLKRGTEIGIREVTDSTVGDWIRENTDRCNFLLDSGYPIRLLTLLESFLQCRLDPVFEGFRNQR